MSLSKRICGSKQNQLGVAVVTYIVWDIVTQNFDFNLGVGHSFNYHRVQKSHWSTAVSWRKIFSMYASLEEDPVIL